MIHSNSIQVKGDLPKEEGFYLYKITNNFDNMIYIGQTINPRVRRYSHNAQGGITNRRKYNHMYNSMRKHGRHNFTFEILLHVDNEWSLSSIEEDLVDYYQAKGISYNNARGGKVVRGWKHTPETRAKLKGQKSALKYPPEYLVTFKNYKEAYEVTGVSSPTYRASIKANPHLPWPTTKAPY